MINIKPSLSSHFSTLSTNLQEEANLEDKLDKIRIFKSEACQKIQNRFLENKISLPELMKELTDIADSILVVSYELAKEEVRRIYGIPRFKDNDGNFLPGEFALIGMGKLGARELHFGSDLDLILIFNRNGKTQGGREVTNREFFAKVTQRIISYLTLHTRYGYAYKVDTELRPSGNAGALVTPLDPWITYYHENAATWEKQALLKARLIYATGDFSTPFQGLFRALIFLSPFSDKLPNEINYFRTRMEKELAKENQTRWNFKKGLGGLVDIEFTVQFLQLKLGKIFEDILSPNTLIALEALGKRDILKKDVLQHLKEGYIFYRKLEIFLELNFGMKESYLDINENYVEELASLMSFSGKDDFLKAFSNFRSSIRDHYKTILKI